ncbi:MAG: tRNA pseudouridine(38-40) synthase TruA [Thermodesulfobacteriota bacterium]
MRNIKLLLEYEGTDYFGWQIQSDLPTIQGIIQDKVKRITGENVNLIAAGRTDTGVHAKGQVCNFMTKSQLPAISIKKGLNALLPNDIVVKDAMDVDEDFNARRKAVSKTYKYLILNRDHPSSFYRRFSWFISYPLDIVSMREGARVIIGKRDFSSFRAVGCGAHHAIRKIENITIDRTPEGLLKIKVKGNAFLRHMVRIMVGTLVALGSGRITIAELKDIVEAKDRTLADMTAPSQGLFLEKVEYEVHDRTSTAI